MSLKEKARGSLGAKLIVMILMATLSISAVIVTVGYHINSGFIESRYIRLGENLTRIAVNIIDGDSLDRYLASGVKDEEYAETLGLLRNLQMENGALYMYATRLGKEGENGWYFVYDTDEQNTAELGYMDPYDENYPEFGGQVSTGIVAPIISKTQWGWLLSVYEPIYNSAGALVGYVGADFSMDEIMAERRSYLMWLIAITLLVSLAFAVLYIFVIQRTILQPINIMARAANAYLAPAEGASPSSVGTLEIHTDDELESLAEAMKSMDQKMNFTIIDLHKANDAARAASRAKTAFLGQMSHELRTPMNAIMGMAREALYEAGDREKVTEAMRHILAASQRLFTILNDILDISNIESGRLSISRNIFSLSDVCRSLNDLAQLQCKAKGVAFFHDTDAAEDVVVWGDRVRLVQAAGAILNNAIKFTDAGGEIRFVASIKEHGAAKVSARFTVSDTGIGISQSQQEMLFQSFVPVDREAAFKYGGVGAKLSICQRIVEMMGGRITVESEIGKGSVFSFEISFDRASVDGTEDDPDASSSFADVNFSGRKILIVDDVATNRAVAKLALKSTGADIIEAKDGTQAVDIVTRLEGAIDLVLMDISMPVMNGYEAARAIRALDTDWARTMPIIALTAHTYQEDIDAAFDAGMDFHLGKPINSAILLSTLARFLSAAPVESS
ncbi:MAG: response regulator [Synergistaceae bacterium]|jgi:signal transduction histidine kinase/CheY-like chemotaxis protein|nr:response regulator [Synergistaceae bacterium]